jgi:hypothetical protein
MYIVLSYNPRLACQAYIVGTERAAPRLSQSGSGRAPLQGGIAPPSSLGRKQQPRGACTDGRAWSLGRRALRGPFRHAAAADRSCQEVAADQVTEGARLGRRYKGRRGAGELADFFSALSEKLETQRRRCQNPPICQALASPFPPLFCASPLRLARRSSHARAAQRLGGVARACLCREAIARFLVGQLSRVSASARSRKGGAKGVTTLCDGSKPLSSPRCLFACITRHASLPPRRARYPWRVA